MDVGALHPYEESLRNRTSLALHLDDARVVIALDVERWLQPADAVDLDALARLDGPALDVGCGPGRIVEALTSIRPPSLGIDISPTAIALARARGLNALNRDVFGTVPLEGRWASVVLLDGNIGIGGDASRLLSRVSRILRPGGRVLIETHPVDRIDEELSVRFWLERRPTGPSFRWALVGRTALCRYAGGLGFDVLETWRNGGRAFTLLSTP